MRRQSSLQWPFVLLCLAPLAYLRGKLFLLPKPLFDFDTYWAAGRLFLTGSRPYSVAQMMHVEQSLGWHFNRPLLMLCPPWTLPVFALAGSLSFPLAHSLWFAISMALDFLSALGLWFYFEGPRSRLWIPLVIAVTFLPMGGAEHMGQVTPLILACFTAFLLLLKKKRYFLAGLCLFGFGFKPQLLYLVLLAILIWIVRQRRWSILGGAALITSTFLLAAAIYNPHSLDYFHHTYSVALQNNLCAIGGTLRSIFGMQHTWLQFLPSAIGIFWFFWYGRRRHWNWDWQRDLPILALVSVSTAAYGWYHDFILVLPALVALGARRAYTSANTLLLYLAVQLVIILAGDISKAWMFTASSLWIAFYLLADVSTPEASMHENAAPQADPT